MRSDVNESIKHNDLRDLIVPLVSIDQYKSKLGEDQNVVVVAFKIKDKDPSEDLSQYIESGYDCLDVDVSPGPDSDGIYSIFVELERNSKLFEIIDTMLSDVQHIDNSIKKWSFICYDNSAVTEWNKENFDANVISDSYDYVIANDDSAKPIAEVLAIAEKISEDEALARRLKFLTDY